MKHIRNYENQGYMSNSDINYSVNKSNKKSNYSKKLSIFNPVDIELLKPLYSDRKIDVSETLQMIMYPDGTISVGFFNKNGSGNGVIYSVNNNTFKEGVDFNFK